MSAQTYITPTTPGWAFYEETPTGSGAFVNGPPGGPAGSTGSMQLTVGAPGGELFATAAFGGIRLDRLDSIRYNTFVFSSALPESANLQFDFDPAMIPASAFYQGRAVFAPRSIGPAAVVVGTWQTWDPMTQRGWWGSGSAATRVLAARCPQSAPCTLAEIIASFPNSRILAGGLFGFKVGNSNSAAVVSIDGFNMGTLGLTGPVVQYRFAPAAPTPPPVEPVPATNATALMLLALLAAGIGGLVLRRRSEQGRDLR